MTDMLYLIRLKEGEFEVEVQGDKDWVENKFKELTAQRVNVVGAVKTKIKDMPETLGEYLEMKGNPKKHTDIIAVCAFWLFRMEGMKTFNVKDIVSCYDKTRMTKPGNPNMIVNQDVATHLFAEAPEKKDGYKAWVITKKGEEYVEQMKG